MEYPKNTIECPECGHNTDLKALVCPECDYEFKRVDYFEQGFTDKDVPAQDGVTINSKFIGRAKVVFFLIALVFVIVKLFTKMF